MVLEGARTGVSPRGLEELPGRANYLIGNNPGLWRTGVRTYAKVAYDAVYPGVNLDYYGDANGLEYDFVVAAGSDPGRIRLRFEGADALEIGADGELVVRCATGPVRWRKPLVYQVHGGLRRIINGAFEIRGKNLLGFRVGPYDRTRPLVIDPVVLYSTYLGGSSEENSTGIASDSRKSAIAVDAAGNAYVTGNTESSDFPVARSFQANAGGRAEALVVKLNAAGTQILFSTYLGGSGVDRAYGIAVDWEGAVYITGRTQSNNFPTHGALQPALRGNEDAFVTKLAQDGSSLVYSTYLGGTAQDDGHSIAVNSDGEAAIVGGTESLDFPLAAAFQTTHRGGQVDAFVAKLNASGNALVFSTYLGGAHTDHAEAVAVDSSGSIIAAGYTGSPDFPSLNAFQPVFGGEADGFITRFDSQGRVSYSTYLGGRGTDLLFGAAVDAGGAAYVAGGTMSTDFPATRGAFQGQLAGGVDGFVAKVAPTGSHLVYATYLGSATETMEDIALAIAVDATGAAFVTGTTTCTGFPVSNAFQPRMKGVRDAFVTGLSSDGSALVYSSFFGGSNLEYGYGIAIEPQGDIVITGRSFSQDLPVPGAVQPELAGAGDAFVAKIVERAPAGLVRAVHAATFRPGGALAAGSIASVFGTDLSLRVEVARSTPLPTNLGGTEVRITDRLGVERVAPLFYVGPLQVNFLVPRELTVGFASLAVVRDGQTIGTTQVRIHTIVPGLFTANSDGGGAPAGLATRITPEGTRFEQLLYTCDATPGSCRPLPIDLGNSGDQVVLTLFATGIRGRSPAGAVQVLIPGPMLETLYAGAQPELLAWTRSTCGYRQCRSCAANRTCGSRLTVAGRIQS